MSRRQIIADLSQHFRERVTKIAEDQMDTCHRMDLSPQLTVSIVTAHLLGVAAVLAIEVDISKEDWLGGCGDVYDHQMKTRR